MSTLWRKLQVPGKLDVFLFDKLYRRGTTVSSLEQGVSSVHNRISVAFKPVGFLEVDILNGSPVDTTITSATPDPYLERWANASK